MLNSLARGNIEQCLELLKGGDLPADERAAVSKALIREEDKLSHSMEAGLSPARPARSNTVVASPDRPLIRVNAAPDGRAILRAGRDGGGLQ